MKSLVDRARQLSKSVAGRIRRAVDPRLAVDAVPLEIRHFIVESIEQRVQPAGGGRRVLPDVLADVKVIAADAAAQRALRVALDDVHHAVVARLREVNCDIPAGFRVHVAYLRRRPVSWPAERPVLIDYPDPSRFEALASDRAAPPTLELTVVRGTAMQPSYSFNVAVVRVGRSEAPQDGRGRTRHNDVAFLEDDDERNKTVTRDHCEIRYNRGTGEYRIFDERSANGTRIIRQGVVIDVPARDPIGVAIAAGDELQFGQAAVRVAIVAA